MALGVAAALYHFQGHQSSPGSSADSAAGVAGDNAAGMSSQQRKILRLLEIAEAHSAVGRLTAPPGANAYEAYSMVLEIDPANEQAKLGLSRLERMAAEKPQ
jgi:hypothetical protein